MRRALLPSLLLAIALSGQGWLTLHEWAVHGEAGGEHADAAHGHHACADEHAGETDETPDDAPPKRSDDGCLTCLAIAATASTPAAGPAGAWLGDVVAYRDDVASFDCFVAVATGLPGNRAPPRRSPLC